MSTLADLLRDDLTAALRRRDRDEARVLRTTLAAIANAEAQPVDPGAGPASLVGDGPIAGAARGLGAAEVPRRILTEDDVAAIIAAERDERLAAAAQVEAGGGDPGTLRAEAAVLDRYLPDVG